MKIEPAKQLEKAVPRSTHVVPRSDGELVIDALAGKPGSFELLVHRYERSVRATCFGILHDWHDAQDVAQDAFLNAYAHLRSLREANRFGSWLLTIARRRAMDLSKANRRCQALSVSQIAKRSNGTLDSQRLIELISALPDHEQAVVLLRYVEGHDVAAIARIRGSPVGTITKQLSRAHARLKQRFESGGLR